jgi:hypothetical protein
MDDLSISMGNLFSEHELKIMYNYVTSKDNEAIIVNNCVYYKKTEKIKGKSLKFMFFY